VLLAGVPTTDSVAWDEVAHEAADGLSLSRPLRFDPHLARAREVLSAGTVGTPRTLDIAWSFTHEVDVLVAATELVDVACWLLDSGPAAVYASACVVDGPPLVKINLLTESGALALIEVAGETDALPRRRDLHLLASDGEIVHRIGQDDLLWSDGRVQPLPVAATRDELWSLEIATWLDGGGPPDRLAGRTALLWNLAAARALAKSLADGEMIAMAPEVGRS
jgi:predicted dehydrogenase